MNKSIDYSKCEYLPDKRYSNSNGNMLFLRKSDETIWKPPFLREPPLSTNRLISEQFFSWPPSLSKFQKQEPPPPRYITFI